MSVEEEVPFETYPCSLGIVVGYDQGAYLIQLPDGRIGGILAQGELSEANVEADIAASL